MEIIAKCGNRCDLCPAYTENIARYGAQAISDGWHRLFGFYNAPETIACVGCDSDGCPHAGDCGIRKCCISREMDNCAGCGDLFCEKLIKNIEAIDNLEKAHPEMTKEDYDMYVLPYRIRETLLEIKKGKEGEMNMCRIELEESAVQPVVYIRTNTDLENLPRLIGESYMKIMEYLGESGMEPAGVPYTAYYTLDMQNMDVEMGFPVVSPPPPRGIIKAREIPAGRYTVCTYKGAYTGMEKVYGEIFKWMAEKGLEQSGPCFEYYYNSPEEVPESELLTKIALPVK